MLTAGQAILVQVRMGSTTEHPALSVSHRHCTACGDPCIDAFAMVSFQTTVIRIKKINARTSQPPTSGLLALKLMGRRNWPFLML